MSLRYDYLTEADEKPQSASPRQSVFYSRLPVNTLAIPPEAISQDGTQWLHCVEAIRDDNLLRIRVITNTYRGISVTVPMRSDDMRLKYLDLRFQVRNSDCVLVTFPKLFVRASPHGSREMYLTARDFKIISPTDMPEPAIHI